MLRTAEATEGERRATWTELFFDLVFVAIVGRVVELLHADPSAAGAVWFGGVMFVVVSAWINYLLYGQRFDTDDVVHRLLKAMAMVAAAALAVTAPSARDAGAAAFAGSYLALRVVLLAMYARAWRHVPEARRGIGVYLLGFSVGALLWAISIPASDPVRHLLWVAGAVVESLTPLVGWGAFGGHAVVETHLEERCGQFMLIVLGEVVVGSVAAVAMVHWGARVALSAAAAAAVVVVCLWWLTFDYVEAGGAPKGLRSLPFLYAHFPVYLAIAALGVGAELAIERSGGLPGVGAARPVLYWSLVVYLVGIMLVRVASARPLPFRVLAVHPVMAAVVIAVGVAGRGVPQEALLWVFAAVLVADLLFKMRTPTTSS